MSTTPTPTPQQPPTEITETTITPDGKYQVQTKTVVTTTTITTPLGPKAPEIPTNAALYVAIEAATNWKGEKDAATAGGANVGATGTTAYSAADNQRIFNFVNTVKGAGWRWSNSFAKPTTFLTNFCYDLQVMCTAWSQIMNLELDMNQVMEDGRTCLLCIQSASGTKTWEYTTTPSGSSHWNASNIPTNLKLWPANTWKRLRLFTHRDSAGVVYYDGIEEDGVYSQFSNASGISALSLGWKPKGLLLLNFQVEGANPAGSVSLYVKNLTVSNW